MTFADHSRIDIRCGADALSTAEYQMPEYRNLSRFDDSLAQADEATMADALSAIREHHPQEIMWVESIAG
ncbi:hypothetical protein F2P45_04300 [Massilia sp. CCM 8733]|uniref:Uncharacterized protein n=1 Tax=Massilia mucilaginosa TaxID=2609282 RepID=A0ABX0NN75_9BURK|nr:hypothetical protein [Massilia mucilaginosa]NHZ88249.1 hypothetical protein [Massilia mucilaginosa]